ncbi:MAG: hypothetical protein JJ863_21260 [Deltaproteobacteria bacterium]|nr:hypothetical protein [Deltaproteobacteria bacterium]
MDFPTLEEAALLASGAALMKFYESLQAFVGRRTRRKDHAKEVDAERAAALWESFRAAYVLLLRLNNPNPMIGAQSSLQKSQSQQIESAVERAKKSVHQIRNKDARDRLLEVFDILWWEGSTIRKKFGDSAISNELQAEAEGVLGALMRHEAPEPRRERFARMAKHHKERAEVVFQAAELSDQKAAEARAKKAAQRADASESGDADDDPA